jgi:hypothetical protein
MHPEDIPYAAPEAGLETIIVNGDWTAVGVYSGVAATTRQQWSGSCSGNFAGVWGVMVKVGV